MSKLLVGAAAVVVSIGLAAGVASAQTGDVTVTASGVGSKAKVYSTSKFTLDVDNDVNAKINNNLSQSATSGDAKAKSNNAAGDVTSGDASNKNSVSVMGSVDNSSALDTGCLCVGDGAGDVDVTASGVDSKATAVVKDYTKITVDNNTKLTVNNNVSQSASTGSATASHNNEAGDVTSGNASNDNDVTVEFDVTN